MNELELKNLDVASSIKATLAQTRDKLTWEGIHDQQQAIRTHEQVGKEVRDAIQRIGGVLPERIAPAEHIKKVKQRVKTTTPKLELDEHYASGLLGVVSDKNKANVALMELATSREIPA